MKHMKGLKLTKGSSLYVLHGKPGSALRKTAIAQTLDSTAKEKIAAEPMGAAKIFYFHREANILHSSSHFLNADPG